MSGRDAQESGRRPRVLVLVFSAVGLDPRVTKQISLLAPVCDVRVAGYSPAPGRESGFLELPRAGSTLLHRVLRACMLLTRLDMAYYWSRADVRQALLELSGERFDLVLANDIDTLPLALRLANGASVHFDAHEYHPREFEDLLGWRLVMQRHVTFLCRTFIPLVSTMSTVSSGLAREYGVVFGVCPSIIINAPGGTSPPPSAALPAVTRLVYHGAAIKSKRIELVLEVARLLGAGYTLDLILVPSDKHYMARLKALSSKVPGTRILPPVSRAELKAVLNDYDVGVCIVEDVSFNYANALPNKFFECIHAALAIVVGPSGEMPELVRHHGCGVVTPSFTAADIAASIRSMTPASVALMKDRSRVASQSLNWESASERLLGHLAEHLPNHFRSRVRQE